MNIDVVVPVLNEEDTLERQVKIILAHTNRVTGLGAFRIIIADNGSTDRTREIGEQLAREFAAVSYMRLEQRGVGRALKATWALSSADIVGYMDLDLATDLRHLEQAIVPLVADKADLVTGSRLAKGSVVIGRSLLREVTSRVFNRMLRLYIGVRFTDGMCGFKFLQRRHLEGLRHCGADSDGWFFATELLVCAEHLGLRILDLPVTWTDDPNSKAKVGKLAVEYTRAMHRLKRTISDRPRRV